MRFADLEGRRVAVWGVGREGRAALTALAERLPSQPVALFCHPREAVEVAAIAGQCDSALPRQLTTATEPPDAAALSAFDVVIKSPGISAYQPELLAARDNGVRFTSGTALWFGENPDASVIGVTGSKGKSSTSALIAHLARSLGVRTALAGNIGLPLLGLSGQRADLWVVELSSFQTGESGDLDVGVVTSLFPDHLDWHGSVERYYTDKLRIAEHARTLLVNGSQPELVQRTDGHSQRELFGVHGGWHVREARGQPTICRGDDAIIEASILALPGEHNLLNACAALAALERVGLDAVAAATSLDSFQPLPHRLQVLGERDGLTWVDDSIATTPNATLAAIDSLPARPLAVIVGGHDRGVDWDGFASAVAGREKLHFLVQGGNGARIAAALAAAGVVNVTRCSNLEQAVARARAELPRGASVALSPGAPSFDQFGNYRERGRRFAELAGFQPGAVSRIHGLGIA